MDIIANIGEGKIPELGQHAISILFIILWIKLINTVMYRVSDFFLIKLSVNLSRKVYLECFKYIQQHSYRFFANNFTGSLIKKINKHV